MNFCTTRLLMIFCCQFVFIGCQNQDENVSFFHTSESESVFQSAQAGNMDAQFLLATKYHFGNELEKDMSKAAYWYEKAATSGHSAAMNNLANLYYDGQGVEQDFYKASELYRKSHEAGENGAASSLADMYVAGLGVPKDDNKAFELYMFDAERGYPIAQTTIGTYYFSGNIVEQDNIKAYAWWSLAISHGDRRTELKLMELAKNMSASDVILAKEMTKKLETMSQGRTSEVFLFE